MYRNKKYKSNKTKGPLKTIDENTTIKLPKLDKPESKENLSKTNEDKELFSQELEVIPASQEPTQRYLSQRSTLCRTQSKCSQRAPTSYFEMVLIKSGVNLDEPDNFVISCDHVTFVCRFREIFVKCQNYPSNVETFRTGLRDALNDKKLAMKLLSGCTIKMPGEDNTYQSQDSMIVNFLMIDFLQEVVIAVVLNKVEECSRKETSTSNEVPLLPLMLSQLRYVTFSHADLIYSRIVEIFQNAVPAVQSDIIANAEMVFQSTKHDAFVEILLNNFATNKDIFHSTTIRTFTNLCLSPRMQSKLRTKAVAYIKDGCPPKILPLLIKLLLKALNDDNEEIIRGLINDLKDILMWEEYDRNNSEIRQSRVDVFNCISQGLTRSKKFFDIWQKTIQNLPPANFRPIDFVVLLLMICIKEERSNYIENIIRRRIKLEHITVDILRKANDKYPDVLAMQMNVLLSILHVFLREKNKLISDFGRNSYCIIFGLGELTQKDILLKLVELTCDKSASSMTTTALELIKELRASYPSNVQNWGMTLMPLLDRISEMTLPQTRLVMELLCSIAFPTPPLDECPALQDQIDMLVKKQIINRLPLVKKQGIIGAVQLIDSVARIEDTITEAMYDLNESYNTVEEIPDGRGKIAANYISRIHSTTMHCPESLALFYDELATVCSSNHKRTGKKAYLDRPFVVWLCELITYYFQNSFIVEDQPRDDLGISLSYQKCINIPDDASSANESELIPIAVNISQLVLVPSNEASSSILVLAPLFNLMRVLHFTRYDGSLEMINALLGCGVILPKIFDEINNADIFYEYDDVQCKHILDILFHTVNWIRETISSFSSQDDPMIRGKVLLRLAELIKIEENICKLLIKAPVDYVPPVCQFMNVPACSMLIKKVNTGRKKTPLKADDNRRKHNATEEMGTEATMANVTATNKTRVKNQKSSAATYMDKFKTAYGPKETYRQMSPDIMLILKVNFNVKYPRPIEEIGNTIGLLEFKFIMTDIINKLESVTGVNKFSPDEQHQYIVYPKHFISDIITQFLEPILKNFQQISDAIHEVVMRVDGALGNADLFTDEMNYLKICFGLCLRLLAALFSWSGFGDVSNEALLRGALLAILVKTTRRQCASKTISTITVEAFKRCQTFESSAIDIKSAVHLYNLVQSFRQFAKEIDLKDTRNLCKKLLCRKWFNFDGTMERGSLCNVYLDELVKGYLKNSDSRRQESILKVILDETQYLKSKDNSLRSFPNFNKANFPMLFRGLCETLISSLSDSAHGQSSGNSDQLIIWEKSCEILNSLLGIVQALHIPRNFVLFLKHAHFYLKIVLQHGLPVYEKYLRENPERVNDLLKSLQVTTRFLHNLCCHSKALKNTSIVSQIPVLRETVENLVFRVKALLAANKCSSVFWMGNLKNKDLHGDVILSQTASWSTANNANSDDEIPEDDASIEETILGDNDNNATGSNAANDSSRSTCF